MELKALAAAQEEYLLDLRHRLHRRPELSMQEFETAKLIRGELEKMNVPAVPVGATGTVGILETGRPGPRLAFRADIDALPMNEEVDWPFRSAVPGVMHACGHDAHTATLMGAARCLSEMRESLCGRLYFCFEPGEEKASGGAQAIVDFLRDRGGVDEVIANHMDPHTAPGVGVIRPGAMNAGNCHWRITVTGRGGHGSRPDQAVDPIRIAARIVDRIVQIPVNDRDPFDALVISPCMIRGGDAFNIIPDECVIEGNMRYFRTDDLEEVIGKMRRVSEALAGMEGATAAVEVLTAGPPVVNDPAIADKCRRVMQTLGIPTVCPERPIMASDDFAVFLQAFPGCYVNFGGESDRPGTSNNPHNTRFFLDERALLPVTEFFVAYAAEFLKK